jgi:hypothetical protein
MTLSLKSVNVINLFAEDLVGTKSFYQDVFGLTLIFEDGNSALFKFENMMVMVRDVSAASELIAPAAVRSPGGGSRFVLACSWMMWTRRVPSWRTEASCCSTDRRIGHGGCVPPASPTPPVISGRSLRIWTRSSRGSPARKPLGRMV